jgi:intein/homing endonuclease
LTCIRKLRPKQAAKSCKGVIYIISIQYRQKRAIVDLRNIKGTNQKSVIDKKAFKNKFKFIKLMQMRIELDEELIKEERLKAAIGICEEFRLRRKNSYRGLQNLFEVETRIRMVKSNLQARATFIIPEIVLKHL